VLALFDAAARYVDRLPHAPVLGFVADVDAQEVPGDTLAQRTAEGDSVRVMTAHASKGLEWPLVVVAGVQEGVWPDLRLRGSLLGADDVAALAEAREAGGSAVDRRAELLAEERRLFYVAVTRAKERLVVTAVAGDEGEDRPSRFLEELGVGLPDRVSAVGRPLTGSGLVAELRPRRGDLADPALREAACRRLARVASLDAPDVPHVAAAHPERWWGLDPLSDGAPLVGEGETVRVSPSKVEAFDTCSLRWFLESAVGVSSGTGPAQVVGSLVHALAELGSGAEALDEAALTARLDAVLPELDLGAPWSVRRRRRRPSSSCAASWTGSGPAGASWSAPSCRSTCRSATGRSCPGGSTGWSATSRAGRWWSISRRQHRAGGGRAGPPPAAGRLPAGRRAGRLRRGARADRARRRGPAAAQDQQGGERAAAGCAARRRGPGLGRRAGRARGAGDERCGLPGDGEQALRPDLPGALQLPGLAGRRRGGPVSRDSRFPGRCCGADPVATGGGARPAGQRGAGRRRDRAAGGRVVVAGAGSGKTATMVARVVWLVGTAQVQPDQVLGLTFTTKAADELAVRVRLGLRRLRAAGLLPRRPARPGPARSTTRRVRRAPSSSRRCRPTTRSPAGWSVTTRCGWAASPGPG
jgi:hypothetical protein